MTTPKPVDVEALRAVCDAAMSVELVNTGYMPTVWQKWVMTAATALPQALDEIIALRAEVERLQKMLDVCNSVHVHNVKLVAERDSLRDQLQRVTEERDEVNDKYLKLSAVVATEVIRAEDQTCVAVADWMLRDAGDDYHALECATYWGRRLRTGAWRGKGEP